MTAPTDGSGVAGVWLSAGVQQAAGFAPRHYRGFRSRSPRKKRAKDAPEERGPRIIFFGRRLYMFPSSKEGWLRIFASRLLHHPGLIDSERAPLVLQQR